MKKINIMMFLLLCTIYSHAEPMEFKWVGNGGNCLGCEWLSAEGEIVEDSAEELEKLLEGYPGSHPRVAFHSRGGDLLGALKMGRVLRKYKAHVEIAKTHVDAHSEKEYPQYYMDSNAFCLSSCAYTFLGGVERVFEFDNRLEFHQFYDTKVLKNFSKKEFEGNDLLAGQYISNAIVRYLDEMSIGPEFYSLMSNTFSSNMCHLKKSELVHYGITTENRPTTNWSLSAYGNGLVAEFQSQEHKVRKARLYATEDHKYYFTVIVPNDYYGTGPLFSSIQEVFSRYKELTLSIEKEKVKHKVISYTSKLSDDAKEIYVTFEIRGETAEALTQTSSLFLWAVREKGQDVGKVDWPIFGLMGFSNIAGDTRLPDIALKNPI